MISREILVQLSVAQLKELCRGYNVSVSGKKSELVERIIAHEETINKREKRLAYGAEAAILVDGTPDSEFEATIAKFFDWCKTNNFSVNEVAGSGCSFQEVDPREIRASFKEYDPAASTLRQDRYVPVPNTNAEIFLEMFFDKLGGEWEMFSSDDSDIEFECHEESFINHMKNIN